MTKKKTMKNIKTPNKFWDGGAFRKNFKTGFSESMKLPDGSGLKDMFSAANMGKSLGAALPGMVGTLGGLAGGLISDGFSTTGGKVLSGIGDAAMMFNPIIGGAIKAVSGLVNRGFGTKWNQEGIANAESQIEGLNSFQSGASDYDTLAQDFTRIGSMNKTIKASDLGEDGWFVNRTTNKANELNTDLGNAYNYAMRNVNNVADNISNNTLANLERNYAAFGGPLFAYGGQTHGSDFTNGLMFINNGGTHESNPYEGVPISMGQEGNPNLVEEGEIIWNDYVFSDRLKVPKSVQKKYKLGNREMTFANAVDKLSKESEERPNDPISMRGLESILTNMAMEQENIKSKKNINKKGNKFLWGGRPSTQEMIGLNTSPYSNYNQNKPQYEVPQGILDIASKIDLSSLKPQSESVTPQPTDVLPNLPTWLRYAPVVGSALGVIGDLFSKPNYSDANLVMEAANKAGEYLPVSYTPIGDYLTYTPFDINYHTNKLMGQAGATRRAIINQSAGNRATAMAGLLAADYNTQTKYGDLVREAEEFNLEQRQAVKQFNRATNQANAEMSLQASRANQAARQASANARLEGITQAAALRDAEDKQRAASRSANLSGLFTNLGNVGIDMLNRADRDMLINSSAFGTLSQKPTDWSDEKWKAYQDVLALKAYGGKINRKRSRKGLTY